MVTSITIMMLVISFLTINISNLDAMERIQTDEASGQNETKVGRQKKSRWDEGDPRLAHSGRLKKTRWDEGDPRLASTETTIDKDNKEKSDLLRTKGVDDATVLAVAAATTDVPVASDGKIEVTPKGDAEEKVFNTEGFDEKTLITGNEKYICVDENEVVLPIHTALYAGTLEVVIPYLKALKQKKSLAEWEELVNTTGMSFESLKNAKVTMAHVSVKELAAETLLHFIVQAIFNGRIKQEKDVRALIIIFSKPNIKVRENAYQYTAIDEVDLYVRALDTLEIATDERNARKILLKLVFEFFAGH